VSRRHLRGTYPAAAGIALLGLGPYVLLSTSLLPAEQAMERSLSAGSTALSLALGMAGAGYALGAVFGAQAALRLVQRRVFVVAEAVFAAASVCAAVAPDVWLFGLGHCVQGIAAGFMLITSLPPLITRFPADHVPLSAAIVSMGLVGVSTAGPLLGGGVAHGSAWRWLLGATALAALAGWFWAYTGYEERPPADPERPVDTGALLLVVPATVAPFLGASLVGGEPFLSWQVLLPLVVGVVVLVVLLAFEARREESLVPIGALTTQLPVTGILVAMVGGAVFVTATELIESRLQLPGSAGYAWCWPMPVGAIVASVVFRRLFATRWVPVLIDAGLAALAAGCAVAMADTVAATAIGTFLIGFGACATVSPGLFVAGLGVRSDDVGRAFALVQLLRSMATYAVAPVLVGVLVTEADRPASGIRTGLLVMLCVAAAGLVAATLVPLVSGARLRTPDLEAWLGGDKGMPSPATAAHLRPGVEDEEAEPLLPEAFRRRSG